MSDSKFTSYKGFSKGMYVARKGRQARISKIHFEMVPPSVTVQMLDNDCEVGTEFDRLEKIDVWHCSLCPSDNPNSLHKCRFCQMPRTYKERVSTSKSEAEEGEPQQQQQQQQQQAPQQQEPASPVSGASSDESERTEAAFLEEPATQPQPQPPKHEFAKSTMEPEPLNETLPPPQTTNAKRQKQRPFAPTTNHSRPKKQTFFTREAEPQCQQQRPKRRQRAFVPPPPRSSRPIDAFLSEPCRQSRRRSVNSPWMGTRRAHSQFPSFWSSPFGFSDW